MNSMKCCGAGDVLNIMLVMRFESKQNYLCQYQYVYVQLCSPLIHLIE